MAKKSKKIVKDKRAEYVVDAKGKALGKVASRCVVLLMGKGEPYFVYNRDLGAFVSVKNMKDIVFTGGKLEKKKYQRFTGYPGHIKTITLKELFEKNPEEVLRKAVYGMLPKNKLRNGRMKRLKFL
ncbi:MAG: hypothetical protein ACD_63C00106G0010 [uncultured bacterium]|nr:MAG: hypothetical protein ACD_63C00106G0010 [uncultured bacterium]